MGTQLHKKYDDDFVKSILHKYLSKDLSVTQTLDILRLKKTRFFELVQKFKRNAETFSIEYKRKTTNRISRELEDIIIHELEKEKG